LKTQWAGGRKEIILKKIDEVTITDVVLLLFLIISTSNSIRGKIRLQKLAFLAQNEFNGGFDFKFKPAQFGPLSYTLNQTILRAKRLGLIKETVGKTPYGNDVFCYSATDEGIDLVGYGIATKKIGKKMQHAISKTAKKYGDIPYGELLDYVHEKYPEYLSK